MLIIPCTTTIFRHSQDRNLGDGSITAFNTTSTFVDSRQIRIHITWVTTATWHFFTGSRYFTKSVAICRQIRKNDQNMFLELVCVVFSSSESKTWSNDTFDPVNCLATMSEDKASS